MRRQKLSNIVILLIIALSGLIMLANTFTHSPSNSYDYILHYEDIRKNQELDDFLPKQMHPRLSYNPPLYYYLFGKINHLIELVISRELDPYYLFRIVHLSIIITIAVLYAFSLVPYLTKNRGLIRWFSFALFIFPNLYLSQVMVRADHLLLLFVHLLFYFWFRFDFHTKLATSRWRIAVWSICLVGMANSRNFALPAFLLFFIWGLVLILSNSVRNKSILSRAKIAAILIAIIVLSSCHYAYRYFTTGQIIGQSLTNLYNIHYYERQKGFDHSLLFLNFQFDRLFENPNRYAKFKTGNSFFPRLYGDMWADHWLYFSAKEVKKESKKSLKLIILMYASLFTILYFTIPILQFIEAGFSLIKRKALNWNQTAALLFIGAFILFILVLYNYSEVGKNSIVKFCYLLGYYWFPFFCLLGFLKEHPKFAKIFQIYTISLFLLCIPLFIYPLGI